MAFLNKGISVSLNDNSTTKTKKVTHKYDGGIVEFVKFINNKKPILVNKNEKEVFKKPAYITSKNDVIVECALSGTLVSLMKF